MKDNTFLAATAAAPDFTSTQPITNRQPSIGLKGDVASAPVRVAESERLSRRYSIDDNGGGYLGL